MSYRCSPATRRRERISSTSREWTAAARARWDLYVSKFGEVPPANVSGIMGFDVAEFGDDLNQLVFRYGGYVERPSSTTGWGGVDDHRIGRQGLPGVPQRLLRACAVDANGVGAGVAPHMRRLQCPRRQGPRETHGNDGNRRVQDPARSALVGLQGVAADGHGFDAAAGRGTSRGAPHGESYEIDKKSVRVMDKDTFKELIKRSPNKAGRALPDLRADPGGSHAVCG